MSKLAKRLSAVIAILLCVCLVFALLGFVGCGGDDDEEDDTKVGNDDGDGEDEIEFPLAADHFEIATTFGVTLITGQDLSMANLRVYVVLEGETSDDRICICGMGASDVYADDNFTLVDSTGEAVESLKITSTSMSVTMKYSGSNYTFTDSSKTTFTGTIDAVNATSAEVVPYTVGRSGDPETYAAVGVGAEAMTVVVYYDGGSDTHADSTITVSNASGGNVLAEGLNTISATTVCTDSTGTVVTVPTLYLNIEANDSGTVTYTAYSDQAMTNLLYTYDLNTTGEIDFSEFYATATYGVTFIVGASFTISNVNVYGVWADGLDDDVCIAGMRADEQFADTVALIGEDGNVADSIEITSDEMEVTLRYTGTKYAVAGETRTFTFTLEATYADYAVVYPYSLGLNGAVSSYAKVGEGADAMCVAVYYTAYSSWSGEEETSYDTHADCTITVASESGNSYLEVGKNTISATTVCKGWNDETKAAVELTVDTVYLNIASVTVGKTTAYTYTAYSDQTTQDENTLLYTYTIDAEGSDVYAVLETDGSYTYGGFLEITDIVVTLYYDGSCNLDCSMMTGYTNWSWEISNESTMTFTISSLSNDPWVGTITYGTDGAITSIVFSSENMTFTPVVAS